MWLLRGDATAAAASPYDDFVTGDSANIWWPDDRAWCVGTEIDLMSSHVGGSQACIADLVSEESLEVLPVSVNQRVT